MVLFLKPTVSCKKARLQKMSKHKDKMWITAKMTKQMRTNEEDQDDEEYLQYEKLNPSLAGSLASGTTAVPSTHLTLSLLRQKEFLL